jgi:hypothetical protein
MTLTIAIVAQGAARDDLAAMLFTSHSNAHLKHILR